VRGSVICAVVVFVLVAAACAAALAAPRGVPAGTFTGCPHDVRPLPGPLPAYAPIVAKVVLAFVHTSFAHMSRTPKRLVGARTTAIFLVRSWLPSGWIQERMWLGSLATVGCRPRLLPCDRPAAQSSRSLQRLRPHRIHCIANARPLDCLGRLLEGRTPPAC